MSRYGQVDKLGEGCSGQREYSMQSHRGRRKYGMFGELPVIWYGWYMKSECGGFPMKLINLKLQGPSLAQVLPKPVSNFISS